ncbi:hypothetical protein [Kitasatospora kifunensis]|uniref:DUF1877 family protein n=1 Tax=Kitasatospora kifunensis TaxID=58351 RepID=A0A7W7VTX1_KITKI|nr:hypothetical protein [Kitasatospora kifunensis]MBB4922049.1 hypothetical protein [Kitasatospora kifunensis]
MSIIIKFFIAPDDTSAASSVDSGPDGVPGSLTCGNFDASEAVIEWESLLTGQSFEVLVASDEPHAVADLGDEGGPLLFVVSHSLQGALTGASTDRLAEVGELWIQERAAEGEVFDPEMVGELLSDLADLARTADRRGHSLYCWMA